MSYKKLRVYILADSLRKELYQELIKIPHYWSIPEVKQVIRSSLSSVSNIVEGHGRKFYQKEFYRFLSISLASSDETQDHVKSLGTKEHLPLERSEYFANSYKTLAIQTLNMMNTIRSNEGF